MTERTLIIAEAGVNHNGCLKRAKEMVAVAAQAGADVVKFQTFSADALTAANAELADYQKAKTHYTNQLELLKSLELSQDDHYELIEYCNQHQIEFLSTGFDLESIRFLERCNLKRLKIPSGEITNLPLLREIAGLKKPIILSTGMADLEEIKQALQALEQAGTDREEITLLQCTTQYPAPDEDANLRVIPAFKEQFHVQVGYSDHTSGIDLSIAAVALGAKVIEKHFTLDRNLPGPDHKASLLPQELERLIRGIRRVELALGNPTKQPSPSEMNNKRVARKSLVARTLIKQGDKFCLDNLTTKRPGTGISPMQWDNVIGKVATRTYHQDELIEW